MIKSCIDPVLLSILKNYSSKNWNYHEDERYCRVESIIGLLKKDKL